MEAVENKELVKGGEFLVKETPAQEVFIPEEFNEEQRMMAQTCYDFVEKEITPILDELDKAKTPDLMNGLMDKAGELGLLGTSVPEQYEGFGMDFNSSMLVAEAVSGGHSFAVALSAHTGIGTLPIQYYGNEEQKQKYLPKLASGEWKAAYCLTEPDSGSDANAGKTKAVLTEDGKHYIINGQKMWITNGGFADIFIVFAKIEDDKNLTAFIVEKDFGGITMNEPEHKLGIKASDTRQVFFNDCKVPAENMLSDRQNGFKIAVNILNIGRIKLGVAAVGSSKSAINHSIKYANERKQFGQSIAEFGAIKHKLAQQAILTFTSESACYRAGQNIDDAIEAFIAGGMDEASAKLKSFEQFAIECAMTKVQGSEALDYVVDEAVQIFGGMGYSADAPVERCYRDARINRIFEGTNEINRMLLVGMIVKRAMKGELNVLQSAMAVQQELMSGNLAEYQETGETLGYEKYVLKNLKKAILMTAGAAAQQLAQKLNDEQEVLMNLADMIIELYGAESAILRAEKLIANQGKEASKYKKLMAQVYLEDATNKIYVAGKEAIASFANESMAKGLFSGLRKLTKKDFFNSKNARREIAEHLSAEGKYVF